MNMQFINPRRTNNLPVNGLNDNKNNILLPYSRLNYIRQQNNNIDVPEIKPENTVNKNDPIKIKWGAPTWYFFHTLAHKIKDEHFLKLKTEILYNIVMICKNLPCPKCTTHATEYMAKINFNSIKTKDDLKNMLFKFHNEVNIRTGAELFPYNELDEKYATAVTVNIIQYFFMLFQDKTFNVTAIANNMHRERVIFNLKDWISKNIQYFDS